MEAGEPVTVATTTTPASADRPAEAPSPASAETPYRELSSTPLEETKPRSDSTVLQKEASSWIAEGVPAESYSDGPVHAVDRTHQWFLLVSIPSVVIAAILALVLYLADTVQATHASKAVAGFCSFCATMLTSFLIYCHLSTYTNPVQQRYICRILVMVPIYAIDSFIALQTKEYGNIVALVRDTYEAYVIYQFYYLLMDYVGGEDQIVSMWSRKHGTDEPTMEHLFPMSLCLKPLPLNHKTLQMYKLCLVQYMVLNPLMTLIAVPLYFAGYYEEGAFEPGNAYPYLAGIRFWSVSFAFTSLVYFFFSAKDFMTEHKPIPKFAAVKAVVFLSFWQSVLLAGLNHFHVIPHTQLWSSDEVSAGLQNFLVCIEMYLVSLAHRWVFSDEPYMQHFGGLSPRRGLRKWVVLHVLSVGDVIDATADVIKAVSPKGGSIHDPLLAP